MNATGYFVLPPGHGKTHFHAPQLGLYDFESVHEITTNPTLQYMRTRCKETGDWSDFDRLVGQLLQNAAAPRPRTFLIPSSTIAQYQDWHFVGAGVLYRPAWVSNLELRGDTITHASRRLYINALSDATSACVSNVELTIKLLRAHASFLESTVHQ
jgi:hypothetical protein